MADQKQASPNHAAEKAARRALRLAQKAQAEATHVLAQERMRAALRLATSSVTVAIIDSFFGAKTQPDNTHRFWRLFQLGGTNLFDQRNTPADRLAFAAFLKTILTRAPKLFDDPLAISRLWKIYSCPHVRPIETWDPEGRGRQTILHSLIRHLIVKFPTPIFLYSVLEPNAANDNFILMFCHIASGGSVAEAVKMGLLPSVMTKRMCHLFMQAPPNYTVPEAVRRAQVIFHDGTLRLANAISGSFLRDLQQNEPFWDTVVQWFCGIGMLDPEQVGPLLDYIRHRKGFDGTQDERGRARPAFLMKGRTADALMRDMEQWHADMNAQERQRNRQDRISAAYKPPPVSWVRSGVKAGHWEEGTGKNKANWSLMEICTSAGLRDEGAAMRHCVSSYAHRCATGEVSIWTLQRKNNEGWYRFLTVEVNNSTKAVVQARGVGNRASTPKEMGYVTQWANSNGLSISIGRW
jgi:hypothetical protein